MSFDFDTVIDRRNTSSLKWELYQNRDILPMWVADMDFAAPPAVLTAMQERVDHGVLAYSVPPQALVEAVIERMERLYHWQVEPHWIVWLPGMVVALNLACRCVGDPGDDVLTFTPIYPPFLSAPTFSDRTLLRVPLGHDGERAVMDLERLEAAMTPRTRVLQFCNPHNPVGRAFTRDEIQGLAEICLKHEVVICSDEIHCDLILDEGRTHIPTATLSPDIAARTITLMSPSKTFNIPGLNCAYAIIPDIKLLTMIGAWMGWRALPLILLMSSLTGAVIGAVFLLLAGKGYRTRIPFGPFLSLGAMLYLFWGPQLTRWYFGLLT